MFSHASVFSFVCFISLTCLRGLAAAQAGQLDPTFGGGGKVITKFGGAIEDASAMAVQSDGKTVVVGRFLGINQDFTDFILARYNVDGTLDPTFGSEGSVITNLGGAVNSDDWAKAVTIQPDGRIVVVGQTVKRSFPFFAIDIALVRYNADGSLDTTFGGDGTGIVIIDFKSPLLDDGNAVALQSDGKILVGGQTYLSGDTSAFAIARFNPDGSLDETFGTFGRIMQQFGPPYKLSLLSAFAIQPDGRILAIGSAVSGTLIAGFHFDFALARYNPDGSLDPTFGGGDGLVTTEINGDNDAASAVALQNNGKIVIAGQAGPSSSSRTFVVARYDEDGSLDPSFGGTGFVMTQFPTRSMDPDIFDAAFSIAIQADGKIVAGGTHFTESENGKFALARYRKDGSLDPAFGNGGLVLTDFSVKSEPEPADASLNDLVLQADGKIVTAGTAFVGSSEHFALARYTVATIGTTGTRVTSEP